MLFALISLFSLSAQAEELKKEVTIGTTTVKLVAESDGIRTVTEVPTKVEEIKIEVIFSIVGMILMIMAILFARVSRFNFSFIFAIAAAVAAVVTTVVFAAAVTTVVFAATVAAVFAFLAAAVKDKKDIYFLGGIYEVCMTIVLLVLIFS